MSLLLEIRLLVRKGCWGMLCEMREGKIIRMLRMVQERLWYVISIYGIVGISKPEFLGSNKGL